MESVLRAWIECFNAKDWKGALRYYSFPIIFNGEAQTEEQHRAHMEAAAASFPSHQVALDFAVANRDEPNQGKLLGARLIVTTEMTAAGKARFGFEPTGPDTSLCVQDLWLVVFEDDGDPEHPKMKEITSAVDGLAMRSQLANPSPTLPDISSDHIRKLVTPATARHDLAKVTREWAAHVAAKACVAHAPAYMHERVYHWNRGLIDRIDMATHLDSMLSAVGEIDTEMPYLAVDLEKQQVAVRYILNTVLVKPFGGMKPNGRKIAIPENCLYQFVDGKIIAIWAAIDMASFGKQMAKEDHHGG